MLKKIVKFGNSSALILDKAILELLGMGEGSVVKLKTDGTSLIITPQQPDAPVQEKPTQSWEEFCVQMGAGMAPAYEGQSPEQAYKLMIQRQAALKELNDKYPDVQGQILLVMGNEEYKREIKLLEQERDETGDYQKFMARGQELIAQFIPDYPAYYAELMKLFPAK